MLLGFGARFLDFFIEKRALTWAFTKNRGGFFQIIYTGIPDIPVREDIPASS